MNRIYSASRLPLQPGPAAWNLLLPEAPPARALDSDITADIAIIGAGFAGLTAARRLMELDPSLDVVVLEAGRVAEGPAGRNSGFMIDLPHDLASSGYTAGTDIDRQETELNRSGIRYASRMAEEFSMSSAVFNPCGKINAAASARGDRHNRDYVRSLEALGEPYELLDAGDMEKVTGSMFYVSGLYTPGTVMIQPAGYVRKLAEAISRTSTIFENSPVTEFAESGSGWRVSTTGGTVSTAKIILANNGHAESFGFFRRQLLHTFTYASMTEPFPQKLLGGELSWGATPADPMGTTLRRIDCDDGSRIVVRSRFTCNPGMKVGPAALASAGAGHERKFFQRFPLLKQVPMAWRWAGHLCLSRNGVPAHGEVAPGVFAAVCQNGLGVTRGTLAGLSAAELVLGKESALTSAMTGYDAPAKLPPGPITWLGANGVMRWKEWLAGRE